MIGGACYALGSRTVRISVLRVQSLSMTRSSFRIAKYRCGGQPMWGSETPTDDSSGVFIVMHFEDV